jgi:hypothetical protein
MPTSTTSTIEPYVRVTYGVHLFGASGKFPNTTIGRELAAKIIVPEQVDREVTLEFPEAEYPKVTTREATKQAARRALRLLARETERGTGGLVKVRFEADDYSGERVKETLIRMRVERDETGKIISRKPIGGRR